MDRYRHIISIVVCMFVTFGQVMPQSVHQYNINQYTGLPSNHVYFSLVDRMGYLWMATDKGVARYNGYEFRFFGTADGIPNEDIWHLYEDKKGRIWLSAVTSEMGYIYNNKYVKTWINDPDKGIYPTLIKENKDGIVFVNNDKHQKATVDICFEKNDSITSYTIATYDDPPTMVGFTDEGNVLAYRNKHIYEFDRRNRHHPLTKTCDDTSLYNFEDSINRYYIPIDNYILTTHSENGNLHVLDLYNCTRRVVKLFTWSSERIISPYRVEDQIYVATNKKIYALNKHMDVIKTYDDTCFIKGIDTTDKYVLAICTDSLWNNCISVPGNGVYINLDKNYYKKEEQLNLQGYNYVGASANKDQYWWNESTKTLLSIDSLWHLKKITLNAITKITKIIPHNQLNYLLITANALYYLSVNSMNTETIFKNIHHYIVPHSKKTSPEHAKLFISDGGVYTDAISQGGNCIYVATKGGGFLQFKINHDTVICTTLNKKTHAAFSFDSTNNAIWYYNRNSIFIYNIKSGKTITISTRLLSDMHIDKIEKLLVDGKSGNVFIKNYNKLLVFNFKKKSLNEILRNYKLDNMTPYLYDNKLILVGIPGILFCNITNTGNILNTVFYPNTKKINYRFLHSKDVQFSGNTILISTDKGAYKIQIPPDNEFKQNVADTRSYNLILNYVDSLKTIHSGDSIYIRQTNYNLKFDVINPAGSGMVQYTKYIPGIDSGWSTVNANELHLTNLEPDKYYDLYLRVSDDIWISDIIKLKLYIIPKWWQTYFGKKIVAVLIVSGILGLAWLIIALTKRNITRKNAEKTMQLELKNLHLALELKSIYAQINPHFIFNSLNTGLLYIKKRKIAEAYTHISAFSGLLRAYIKASRNKFITLKEEIDNLKNYILLQEARFKNRFNFEIITDNRINQDTTIIPSLLLQPLVENAISHGLFHKEETGNLVIEFKKGAQDNELLCIIDDDGVGRETAMQFKENARFKTESYGTDLVKDLISIFNKYESVNIAIEYIDKKPPQTGTTVILTIKYLHDEPA